MANNEQIPMNPAAVIEAAEADVIAREAAEAKQTAEAETKKKSIEERTAALEGKLKHGDALVTDLETYMAKPTPQMPTGFRVLDKALGDGLDDGGLPPGLITIGAIPSLGKTAIVLQMADQMAEAGHDVLIIALEMASTELVARSISRLTAKHLTSTDLSEEYPAALTAKGVRLFNSRRGMYTNQSQAEYWTTMADRLKDCIDKYRDAIAPHIYIHEPETPIPASMIKSIVHEYTELLGKTPVVIVDYIQILAPEPGNERNTEKANMDAAALTLKHISRDYKIPVICISSFNRMNYNEQVSMESFKESGGIEYSSDVVVGMQLYGTGMYITRGQALDVDFEKGRTPRRIQARVLKNRDGITGQYINLEYFPAFNLFREVSERPVKTSLDVPDTWKANKPMMKITRIEKTDTDTDPEKAVDITGIIEAPKKEHKVTSRGK